MDRRAFLRRAAAWTASGTAYALVPFRFAAAKAFFADSFARRSSSKGWGKPWFNQRYGLAWGISQKKGFYDLPEPFSGAGPFNPNPVLVLDHDVMNVDLSVTFYPSSDGARFGLVARNADYSSYYIAYLDGASIVLSRFETSRDNELARVASGAPVQAGKGYKMRFKVAGTSPVKLQAKVWRTGKKEPRGWTINAQETDLRRLDKPGPFGLLFMHDDLGRRPARVRVSKFAAKSGDTPAGTKPGITFAYAGRLQPQGTNQRLRVVARTDTPASVKFRFSSSAQMTNAITIQPDEVFKKAQVSKAWIPNLAPGSTLFWQVIAQGKKGKSRSKVRSYKTPAQNGAISFAFGSCSHFFPVSRSFGVAASLKPNFFAHLGDWGYPEDEDGATLTTSTDSYQDRWIRMFMRPELGNMHEVGAWIGLQDDHDYGTNNAWSQTVKPFTLGAFDQLSGNLNERHFEVRYGDLHAFFVDCHVSSDDPATPDGPNHSILGQNQKDWLKDAMRNSNAPLRVLFTPLPLWGSGSGDTTWKQAFENERKELVAFLSGLQDAGARVIVCAGNSHANYINRHTDPGGKDLFEFVSSGTDRIDSAGSRPVGVHDNIIDPTRAVKFVDAFGFVTMDAAGPNRKVTLRSIESSTGQNAWPPLVLDI
ncbi:MAG: alkaline phosphatase [Actinomycetota bacterium]|jgi:phosphodiesterase/alkaline phosphatase D-like protein|nr:alkaline phosphatase [Actinomycetota bacterium]